MLGRGQAFSSLGSAALRGGWNGRRRRLDDFGRPGQLSGVDAPRRALRHSNRTYAWARRIAPWLFLAPYLVLTSAFFVYPLCKAAVLALHQTNGPRSRVFVGLENFKFLAQDPDFRKAAFNTTLFAIGSVGLQLPLALGLALLLNGVRGRAQSWLRLVLFSPNLVGQIFVGILFAVLLAPRYGLVNQALAALTGAGLETRWLGTPALVMPAIVLTSLWLYVGFNMVFFLAALQSVDQGLLDAARVDGASRWQTFRHVTLPALRPVIVFVVIVSVIGSYQLYELPRALLGPMDNGPDNAGLTLIMYVVDVAFRQGDLGLGSAAGWVVAVLIFVVSLIQLRLTRERGDTES